MFWKTIVETATQLHWAELGAVVAGIIYVVLAARENIWCWLFGILGSALSIYLFFISRLYAESVLYAYYVFAGFYGWYAWTHEGTGTQDEQMPITNWPVGRHLLVIAGGVAISMALGFLLKHYTNALMPLVDAHVTIFSFIATYMVTRKVLANWLYWIAIDAVSTWLYASRDLYLYSLLMAAYTVIAIWGYLKWRRHYLLTG